ncbi:MULTISPECIES: hypothetical protein [unclassified Pseudomonas]|uniref:hypothetical protein n=1 Tax=unclassified Pseudomonas TaxID=196821 RepID=UPI00088F6983|nr:MULTISPECIES: hypothetical protein [unclassified Pseudomonas]QVM98806.1 hypothetical protein JYG36_11795 [Pseudomonas sp. SORT22]UVL54315.1 hypothetical protein LOY22_15690 [Pseudomonas sp. B21-035]SDQ62012.1 hypothetical protein SAMN05216487_2893 [Pseudomonas sp. UC 17F4]
MVVKANSQTFTILAQDPAVRDARGQLLFARVSVPLETLGLGPTGYRLKVVDFDASRNQLYHAHSYQQDATSGAMIDPFDQPGEALLGNPAFHCQHVYAVVMRTLARFEMALGRRVGWGFEGHQLHVVPHAFVEANAFYSRADRALMFGYFKGLDGQHVFTCLSHDIVAHEATHAILDGLRGGFMNASGPDQAAFHEGFADVVALLSVFSLREIIEYALTNGGRIELTVQGDRRLLNGDQLSPQNLAESLLFGIGEEFGQQLEGLRANALRRSVMLPPSADYLSDEQFAEAHNRGEVFAAAMLRSMLALWVARLGELGNFGDNLYNLREVVEEGAKAADQLLTIAIRALDYCPPLDLEFGDYLAALLTVDAQVAPDDSRYDYRLIIRTTFEAFGINPPPARTDSDGCWHGFADNGQVQYRNSHFDSMLRDDEEVFRFLWENRAVLGIDERAYTEVVSVRPSIRLGTDGLLLRESVCEYIMKANIFGAELKSVCNISPRPAWIKTTDALTVYGAGTLIFDQYGRIKYHVQRPLNDGQWQLRRLSYLAGLDTSELDLRNPLAQLHRQRAWQVGPLREEQA